MGKPELYQSRKHFPPLNPKSNKSISTKMRNKKENRYRNLKGKSVKYGVHNIVQQCTTKTKLENTYDFVDITELVLALQTKSHVIISSL